MAGVLTGVATPRRPGVHAADADIGVPVGTAALALEWAGVAAARATSLTGREHVVHRDRVLAHVLLPLLVGDTVAGTPPRPAPGGGHVHADIIDEDEPLYAAIVAGRPDASAEDLARLAQECRLPVVPYRNWRPLARASLGGPSALLAAATPQRRITPHEITVVDLTAMWAGPLCSMLLAGLGIRVVTIESVARPDGLRGAPPQFAALDHGKRRVDLDLRRAGDRLRFEQLLAGADVVLESFSRRVLPNFGYAPDELRRLNPRLTTVAIRAFPATSAEREWLGYGRGAHAASGLGMWRGAPQRARLAYPDPIAGLVALATVLDVLGRNEPPPDTEISLAGVIEPLVALGERPLGAGDPHVIARLQARVGMDPGPAITAAAR